VFLKIESALPTQLAYSLINQVNFLWPLHDLYCLQLQLVGIDLNLLYFVPVAISPDNKDFLISTAKLSAEEEAVAASQYQWLVFSEVRSEGPEGLF
jgi:hypothetical protein